MTDPKTDAINDALTSIRRPAAITRAGMVAERAAQAFWPAWSVLFVGVAAVLLGLIDPLPFWTILSIGILWLAALVLFGLRGAKRFAWPTNAEALLRLDTTLRHAPIAALQDQQLVGTGDAGSQSVWAAHQRRMMELLRGARPVAPDLKMAPSDPFGLRLMAVTALIAAVLFGGFWRVAEIGHAAGSGPAGIAAGPAWEGWIEPPSYTGKPTLYLNDLDQDQLIVPQGSRVTLRLYGEQDALAVVETVSDQLAAGLGDPNAVNFNIAQAGQLQIQGDGGRMWEILLAPDGSPMVDFNGTMRRSADGEMQQPFTGSDDYGVINGRAQITLAAEHVTRAHGLVADPDPRPDVLLDLPLPISGDRANFDELLIDNLSEHPWVGLPVQIRLSVDDARGQTGYSDLLSTDLPGLRFFDPLAKAVIEQRRDILWARANGPRVRQMLRAIGHRPTDVFRDSSGFAALRKVLSELDAALDDDLTAEEQEQIAELLWDLASLIEFGDLQNALDRLQRAQDRLEEAMRNGASDEEIAELMRELQQAMQEYIRQLAQEAEQTPGDGTDQPDGGEQEQRQITSQQLQEMLDEIQRLMEEGKMAEAMALMEQLRQLMENLQVNQGGQGGQPSPGQQAMEGLAETLREQQGLSDQAFQDLQNQFGSGQQPGQQGQGEQGENGQQSPGGEQGQGQGTGSLADQQQALRDALRNQQRNMPAIGGENGQAARDALDRAGRAMERAEDALRNDDLAGALNDQAEAMDALRDGMQNLGEAMAQQQQQGEGQGQQNAQGDPGGAGTDPFGRIEGDRAPLNRGDDGAQFEEGDNRFGRAQDLSDEIQRRSTEQDRPSEERDFLNRLLDRFE